MKIRLLFLVLIFLTVCLHSPAQMQTKGLMVNENAPDFHSRDQNSKVINLKNMLKKGPVVLIFYRGEWCPYCNRQLKELEDSLSQITSKGGTVVAVTPETLENINKTIKKTNATYSIVPDIDHAIMDKYSVSYEIVDSTANKLKLHGIDLEERNESNGNVLPVPAVYVIGQDGKIKYSFFNQDYKKRASVAEIVSHLGMK